MNRPSPYRLSAFALAAVASCGLQSAPAAAQVAQASNSGTPQVYTMSPTQVEMESGKFKPTFTDLAMGPLKLTRGGPAAMWGGTSLGAGIYVSNPPSSNIMATVIADGQSVKFSWTNPGWMPWSANAYGTTLTLASNRFTFTDRAGNVYSFMPHAALTNLVMTNGTQVLEHADYADGSRRDLSYDSQARLRTVIDDRGYAVVFDFDSNGNLATACGYNMTQAYVDSSSTCAGATVKATYGYTARSTSSGTAWDLTSVTGPNNDTTQYQYTSSGLMSCIIPPGMSVCQISNTFGPVDPNDFNGSYKPYQVRDQVTATGEHWHFAYSNDYPDHEAPRLPGQPLHLSSTDMTDPLGNITTVGYSEGQPTSLTDPSGTTQYNYNGSDPVEFVSPEGNLVHFTRDNRGNATETRKKAKPGSTLADIVSTASFPYQGADPQYQPRCEDIGQKACNKPLYTIDPNGNRTDFTYDPASGLVLTETGPAVNGVHPQTRYSYVQRYAWVKDSSGNYVHAAAAVWLLASKSMCKTSAATGNPAAPCATAGDEVVTTYDYGPDSGPNNLQLRGTVIDAGGLNLRTCVTYDAQGNKLSETQPLANLSSCPAQ